MVMSPLLSTVLDNRNTQIFVEWVSSGDVIAAAELMLRSGREG